MVALLLAELCISPQNAYGEIITLAPQNMTDRVREVIKLELGH